MPIKTAMAHETNAILIEFFVFFISSNTMNMHVKSANNPMITWKTISNPLVPDMRARKLEISE